MGKQSVGSQRLIHVEGEAFASGDLGDVIDDLGCSLVPAELLRIRLNNRL